MTRSLELVQGLIRTRHGSAQVNTEQDWSLGHGVGCAGRAVPSTTGWHRAMPVEAEFTPVPAFCTDRQKTESGRIGG